VKRHGIKLSDPCGLGGLSFFLFIFLTITGIVPVFLLPAPRRSSHTWSPSIRRSPSAELVRNLHRWAAQPHGDHGVPATWARFFYTGSYKPPREFNWIIGVTLSRDAAAGLHRLPAAAGTIWPSGRSRWVRTGCITLRWSEKRSVRPLRRFESGASTCFVCTLLHVLRLPFVIVIRLAVHFWMVRKEAASRDPSRL